MPEPMIALGAAGVASSLWGSKKAGDAADAQVGAANQANATQWEMYKQTRQDQMPWLRAGQYALGQLAGTQPTTTGGYWQYPDGTIVQGTQGAPPPPLGGLAGAGSGDSDAWNQFNEASAGGADVGSWGGGFQTNIDVARQPGAGSPTNAQGLQPRWVPATTTPGTKGMIEQGPGDFYESPSYQFNLAEGGKALDRYNASRGLYASGKAAKDLSRFSQGLASNEYQNFVNNWIQTKLNPMQSLAGLGQTSAQGLGNQGMNYAANMGNAQMQAGTARASGYINQSNAVNQGLQGVSDFYMMNKYLGQGTQAGLSGVGQSYPIQQNLMGQGISVLGG